ncbi:hypothetical protein F5X68DRAFT_230510 [Plectosphaerella plurivora]|uniref:Zn(2)-C6 fungal-type domain-containing protein n=1 Tax=Plectosphaerella plurivora TaxID=936078 RepID=A0A9P8VFH8_9PEZI|nr:hypothetical protein F5X68DRAFT_230510 [Plectosphaerella plurivora]
MTGQSSSLRQACKLCQRRKIKCDGLPTCGNCLGVQINCEYTLPRRRGPKPGRWRNRFTHGPDADTEQADSPSSRRRSPSYAPSSSPPSASASASAAVAVWSPEAPLAAIGTTDDDGPSFSLQLPHHSLPPAAAHSPFPLAESIALTRCFFETPSNQAETAIAVHLGLLTALQAAVPSMTTAALAHKCVDLYTRYVFGAFPLCHEASVRANIDRFYIPLLDAGDGNDENWAHVALCLATETEHDRIATLRSLAFLTALCANVAYVVSDTLLPQKLLVAPLFLRAARRVLATYEDYDLEYPDSSSIRIRTLFSSAIQSATGMLGEAFHVLNQAGLIAMSMRLYDERSLQGLDPVEETLLRNTFWQLYISDQTALVMKGRAVTIHEALFQTEFTIEPQSPRQVPLLMHDGYSDGAKLEESLAAGFHVICRLWTMASRVVHGIKSLARREGVDNHVESSENRASTVARLSATYFEVITLTDDFPSASFPAAPAVSSGSQLDSGTSPGSSCRGEHHLLEMLQRQRTSYLVTLHTVKALVLSSAAQCGMAEVLGISQAGPSTLAMKQIEVAQDFSHILESVPFLHLQTEGEHCSEKIRWIGSMLLEIAHDAASEVVKTRATQCAMRLVDMLARLDSKASDVLGQQMMIYQL